MTSKEGSEHGEGADHIFILKLIGEKVREKKFKYVGFMDL